MGKTYRSERSTEYSRKKYSKIKENFNRKRAKSFIVKELDIVEKPLDKIQILEDETMTARRLL